MFSAYVKYYAASIFLAFISKSTGEVDVVSEMKPCSLKRADVWSIYYRHLITSKIISVKVLTCKDSKEQNDVTDFANSMVQTLNYLNLPQRLEYFSNNEKLVQFSDSKNINIKMKSSKRRGTSSKSKSGFRPFLNESTGLGIVVVRDEHCIMNYIENGDKINIFKKVQMRYMIVFTRRES